MNGTHTQFGFSWGPMEVERTMSTPTHHCVAVKTKHAEVHVYVSNGGRRIRVFRGGEELKP